MFQNDTQNRGYSLDHQQLHNSKGSISGKFNQYMGM